MAVILVVDDHPGDRDFLAALLGYSGHTVLEAGDGATALLITRERHPALIITDLVMPVMDGYELVRELRGDPSLAVTKVIFYTANYLRDEAERVAAALGVRHVVSKPADPPALLAMAEEMLKDAETDLISPVPEAAHTDYLRVLSGKLADRVRELEAAQAVQAQTQREEPQAELPAQRAAARFRGLLDAAPDAMVCADSAGNIVLVNAQTERLFGYQPHELAGQPVEILVPDAIKAGHRAHRARYVADPRPRQIGDRLELSARRRDGSTFPCEISLSAVDTGADILVVAAVRDVRERLELQAERERLKTQAERDRLERQLHQSQRLESLGQLAGGVAHDFNNLLAVISNYAAFVAEEIDGQVPRQDWQVVREDIEQIQRAAERAAGLTHQLLAFARRDVIRLRALNLNHVIEGVEQLLLRTLGEHVELSTALAAGPCPVLADPGQIEQVLVNLAVNARDAMPGGGELIVATDSADVGEDHPASRVGLPPGRYVRLQVSDTGTGMPQDVIDRAFEPFFTTKAKGEGTGLGLATVYGIVTQLGGHVRIHSEPGHGTTFTILLPETSQPVEETSAPPAAALEGVGQTVLVVEDEPAMREVTRRILTRNGYQVITAIDGRDAVEVAAGCTGTIDVLVTDVIMPHMLGKEAAQQIRALHPAIKVLYMSGYTQGILDTQGVIEAGVHLIEKPFTAALLLAKLSEIISART